ncbi:hypothetical protein [Fluviispira multicolorata]|nr:hypothetical protein [Fluviispira multicolorata]
MHFKFIKFLSLFFITLILMKYSSAQTVNEKEKFMNKITEQSQSKLHIQIPKKFTKKVKQIDVKSDNENVELIRYERSDGINSGVMGEHFSLLVSKKGYLKGFTQMDTSLATGNLPSSKEAEEIAMEFLNEHAPDLLSSFKISWIDKHDEQIQTMDYKKIVNLKISGMKVKMQNTKDKKWFWIIVGTNHKVIIFERDIVWISFPGHRKTEKWLHDSWILSTNFPQ